jgi:ADP-heptose:LPS heptosyltransferase
MNHVRSFKRSITLDLKRIQTKFKYAIFYAYIWIKKIIIRSIKKSLWPDSETCFGINAVVVIKIGGLGDFVFGIAALNLLRAKIPNARIILVTAKSLSSLGFKFSGKDPRDLSSLPWVSLVKDNVDQILSVPDLSLKSIRKLKSLLPRSKRKAVFILGYPGMTFSSTLKKIIFARLLTNYSDACFGTDKSLDWRFMRQFQAIHKLSKHKMIGDIDSVMEAFPGTKFDLNNIDFKVSIAKDMADRVCDNYGIYSVENLILLAPLATTLHKQWPLENFVHLIRSLNQNSENLSFALIGTLDHYEVLDSFFNRYGLEIQNLCGQLSIEEVAALFSVARGYIGNDGGMSQLAGIVGCPSVIAFNSVEEEWITYPWRSLNGVVRQPTYCSPCFSDSYCPEKHHKCMVDISIDSVYSKVVEVILSPAIVKVASSGQL